MAWGSTKSGRLLYNVAVVSAAALTLWLSFSVSVAHVYKDRQPTTSLGWWRSADALVAVGTELVANGETARAPEVATMMREALAQTPVNPGAVRNLAVAEGLVGNANVSERLFRAGETLSRRDLQTQLWHIESCVARDDIGCALTHYDRALRTSLASRDILLPVLVQAAEEPSVRQELLRLISSKPSWRVPFLDQVADNSPNSEAVFRTLAGGQLDLADTAEQGLFVRALWRLIKINAYQHAFELYRTVRPPAAVNQLLRNGGFEAESAMGPFEWQFSEEPDLSATRVQSNDGEGETVLSLVADNGRGGSVARQVLALTPGRYRLSFRTGNVSAEQAGQPLVELGCIGGVSLARMRAPLSVQSQTTSLMLEVPADKCAAQSFQISLGAAGTASQPWIDAIELAKIQN
ncbi:MAG: hypothetical protein EOP62_13180 [Sphingomonadales bacterium]|nr:MAG: hypothetical protein EOP62_13180 [Sphingomonadales bacterium]